MTVSDYNFCSTGYCWAAWQTMSWQMRPALWPSSRTLLLPMVSSSIMPPSMGSWDRFVCWGPKNLLWFVLWWDDVSGGLLGIWLISVSQVQIYICYLLSHFMLSCYRKDLLLQNWSACYAIIFSSINKKNSAWADFNSSCARNCKAVPWSCSYTGFSSVATMTGKNWKRLSF